MLYYASAIYERVLAICSISGALEYVILCLRAVVQRKPLISDVGALKKRMIKTRWPNGYLIHLFDTC